MLFSATVVIGLSLVSFSPLVFGDPTAVLIFSNSKVKVFPNDYIDRVTTEFTSRKNKNTLVTFAFLVKKTFPDTVQMTVNATYNGDHLVDYATAVCEGLEEPTVGKDITRTGLPKGEFPQQCPFGPGDFSVRNWDPPSKLLPPLPDGKGTVRIMLINEGEPWYAIDFDAELKNRLPAVGR